ncbi:hypothetical protein M271_39695 [Streptomyces rapamycinicus NRRL 5491]|uniref:Uncharacterized protein n=2 Tax=Streptomyces rapamycinicus TaxID=1226757 RepID=A0A0A0NVZ1_STRRN|nr:hypothetical protein M271_39695 [Streptomyces rapamycinicus NRRL 5491]RLV77490.1 hypothetical protein D3C57_103935 [Streptomyces rapamycinicus NRRL 5491]
MMADMPPIDAEDTLDDEMCAPVVNEATGEVRVLADGEVRCWPSGVRRCGCRKICHPR